MKKTSKENIQHKEMSKSQKHPASHAMSDCEMCNKKKNTTPHKMK